MSDDDSMGADSETSVDSWETWNSFRLLCEHHSQLSIALDIVSTLPSANSLGRWFGELVRSAIISTDIIISGKSVHPRASVDPDASHAVEERHPLRPYLDYVAYLYQRMDPIPEQERFELGYRDFLQAPLQPPMDNLEAQTYETFEKDIVKYSQYQRAVCKALLDRVPDEKSSEITTVLMVIGAGRGPLVRASVEAAEETGRRLKVYAVEFPLHKCI